MISGCYLRAGRDTRRDMARDCQIFIIFMTQEKEILMPVIGYFLDRELCKRIPYTTFNQGFSLFNRAC